jgi:hypothetical protein
LGKLQVKTAKKDTRELSTAVWFGGLMVRTLFIAILVLITSRVASPQLEHIWSIYETPSDLVRVILGLGVCVWLVVHIFILPKDRAGYLIWIYLGVLLLPLSALCAFVIW